jgi:hypothetical protein
MRRALGLAGLAAGLMFPAPAADAGPPRCATVIVRSIAGTYCEPVLWIRDSPIV